MNWLYQVLCPCHGKYETLKREYAALEERDQHLFSTLKLTNEDLVEKNASLRKDVSDRVLAYASLERDANKLQETLRLYEPPFKVVGEKMGTAWVDSMLSVIPNWQNGVTRRPQDNFYWIPSFKDSEKIVAWDMKHPVMKEWSDKPSSDRFDCENRGYWVKARVDVYFGVNNFGFIDDYSGEHLYNCFLTPDTLFILERQDGEYWDIRNHKYEGRHALQSAVIYL